MSELGTRVRAGRKAKGLTQQDLAHDVGVRLSTISSIECGHSQPRLELLNKIATRIGLSAEWLIKGDAAPATDHSNAI